MRRIAFIFLAATMIISCSNDGRTALDTAPVAAVVKGDAGQSGFSADDKIGITGGDYENVQYIYGEGGFSPEDTAIVFTDSNPVTFNAYYPYSGDAPAIPIDTSAENQKGDNQKKIDFLYATGAEASSASPAISFTREHGFKHVMSKVTIRFEAGDNISFDSLKPTGFTLSGLMQEGTFDTRNGTAEPANDVTTSENLTVPIPDTLETSLILIPQTVEDGAGIKVTFNDNYYAGTLSNSDADTSLTLKPGYEYSFIVKVSLKGLEIETATIAGWTTGASGSGTVTI